MFPVSEVLIVKSIENFIYQNQKLRKIQSDLISTAVNGRNQESPYQNKTDYAEDIESVLDRSPSVADILASIPVREDIEELRLIPGLFFFTDYITDEDLLKYRNILQEALDTTQDSKYIQSKLTTSYREDMDAALDRYCTFVQRHPRTVLKAITNAAPIVIANHHIFVDGTILATKDLLKSLSISLNMDSLWDIPYTTVRFLYEELLDHQDTPLAISKLLSIREIDRFRSPLYDLRSYFQPELHYLEKANPALFDSALNTLKQITHERLLIPTHPEHHRTHIPSCCVKMMSLLARKIFKGITPGIAINIYNLSKARNSSYSPILSLQTPTENPLTRTHGEVHDAVCTLWAAGNKVISDQMIARTIWPRTDRHGSESFSLKELNMISQVMDELNSTRVRIDATNELRHYKKISKNDQQILDDNILRYSVIYTKLNGSPYLQRAYKILNPPVLMEYSTALSQVFTAPLSILETYEYNLDKLPRTFCSAQVRTYILERIHHFQSPSFQNKECIILLDGVYEAYNNSLVSTGSITKKERTVARKVSIRFLDKLKKLGMIYGYKMTIENGVYKRILIDMHNNAES